MADEQKQQEQAEPETGKDYKALYEQSQKNLDFADRMRAAAHTAKDMQLSKKNGDKLSTLRSNSVIRIGDIRSSNIIRRNKQFGHKATTHRKDWITRVGALIRNPKTDGGKLKGTIATIIGKADAVVVGTTWRSIYASPIFAHDSIGARPWHTQTHRRKQTSATARRTSRRRRFASTPPKPTS